MACPSVRPSAGATLAGQRRTNPSALLVRPSAGTVPADGRTR
jgi:hypothetical protein